MKPHSSLTLCHVALRVNRFSECLAFYTERLGMRITWQPDADNVYLTSGHDNLALHRATTNAAIPETQTLDHMGFSVATPEDVDAWYETLKPHVTILQVPRTHRDGARSFYCADPDGNT